ncbi:hypothetical protein OYC64_007111, partial [Pagothenia borchgrevinki]
MIRVEYARSIP